MTGLGGSRPIQARWNYVQSEEPTDRRDGVRWIDTSGENHVTRVFTSVYDEWMRETRIWSQETAPAPRVGPIDGDQWIDTSGEDRPTKIYSAALDEWVQPIPSETGSGGVVGGYQNLFSVNLNNENHRYEVYREIDEISVSGASGDTDYYFTVDWESNGSSRYDEDTTETFSEPRFARSITAHCNRDIYGGQDFSAEVHLIPVPQHVHSL